MHTTGDAMAAVNKLVRIGGYHLLQLEEAADC